MNRAFLLVAGVLFLSVVGEKLTTPKEETKPEPTVVPLPVPPAPSPTPPPAPKPKPRPWAESRGSVEPAGFRSDGWKDSQYYPGWQFRSNSGSPADWRLKPEPDVPVPLEPISADEYDSKIHAFNVPSSIRNWYRNPDGSCVQCSIGMCGVDQNYPVAATLLWDTEYGKRERGGSYPGRVAKYAEARGIRIYNVTGESNTFEWMKWACRNGKGCAIGAGGSHFQTLVGYKDGVWSVCNNNSPLKIDRYDEAGFRRLHMASGPWIVILDVPPHPEVAEYVKWW